MTLLGTRIGGQVVIDPNRLAAFVRSPTGPVLRDLERRITNVQTGAIAQVGKVTRTLERSIVKRSGVDGQGPFVLLVTEGVDYAMWHHEGTPPHEIRPRNRTVLRFPASGGIVFTKVVHHPGTQPNRFFTDNLHLASH